MNQLIQLNENQVVGCGDSIIVWNIDPPQIDHRLTGHTNKIRAIELISPQCLIGGGDYGKIILWKLNALNKFEHNSTFSSSKQPQVDYLLHLSPMILAATSGYSISIYSIINNSH